MRKIIAAFTLLGLTGCGRSAEITQLQAIRARLIASRDRQEASANHYKDYRDQVSRLDADFAKMKPWLPDTDAGTVIASAEKASGATIGYAQSPAGPVLTASGKGPRAAALAALDRLAAQEPGLVLHGVHVGATDWSASLALRSLVAPPMIGTALAPSVVLPPPSVFGGAKAKALRAEIAKLQQENEELRKILGDTTASERTKARVIRVNQELEEPDRLRNAVVSLDLLFSDRTPVFATGDADFSPRAHATGTLAPHVTIANVSDRIHGAFDVVKIEGQTAELRATP